MRDLLKYGFMFIVLSLVQVLIFNQVHLGGSINPFIYILFVLLLPINTPRYILLLTGFILGLVIDIFSNSLGMHAAATVFIAYLRPFVIRIISNREEDRNNYPGLKQNSFSWFLAYALIMVFLHHLVFFFLEFFTFTHFMSTLLKVILSSLFSVFIIIVSQYLIFRE
ncbi:MAG TPA: rod shape-determining protein MreD [Mariniphaga sp.]|nr:rod shape-determining protein MreD [Mariniphaga sp.]